MVGEPASRQESTATRTMIGRLLATIPLVPPMLLLIPLLMKSFPACHDWIDRPFGFMIEGVLATAGNSHSASGSLGSQLLAHVTVALLGHIATDKLVPHIQQYTLKKGICGKDLGKRGTSSADKEM